MIPSLPLRVLTRLSQEYIGVFGCAYSITIGVRVSRTRRAPARPWPELNPPFAVRPRFSRDTLSTNSDGNIHNPASARSIETIAVLGAGTMGHGIAQVAAAAGYAVVMRDINTGALARGMQSIERNLAKAIQLGKITEPQRDEILQRIRGATSLEEIRGVDLVIEAAPENLELKQNLLREAEVLVDTNCIFATNTSSLSIGEIASAASRPENVAGMHF